MSSLDFLLRPASSAMGRTGLTLTNTMMMGRSIFMLMSRSIYRRGARRWRKMYKVNGHIFQVNKSWRCVYLKVIDVFSHTQLMKYDGRVSGLCDSCTVAFYRRPQLEDFCQQNSFTKIGDAILFRSKKNFASLCTANKPTHTL